MTSRIPGYMVRQQVAVTAHTGTSAYADLYAPNSVTLRCRIEPSNRLVRVRAGEEIVAAAKMFVFPEAVIKPRDRVVWEGQTFEVLTVMPVPGMSGRIHHKEVMLGAGG